MGDSFNRYETLSLFERLCPRLVDEAREKLPNEKMYPASKIQAKMYGLPEGAMISDSIL